MYEIVGKLGAELGKVFSRVGQVVANERYKVFYVIDYGGHVRALVTDSREVLP